MDPSRLVLIALRNDLGGVKLASRLTNHNCQIQYLNDFIPREFQEGNVSGVASHEVAIQDPQDAFVSNDE